MPSLTPDEISAIDAAHVWHPYSAIGAEALPPVVAVGAHGAWLTLIDDGRRIEALDAMASWWTAIHGHGHPVLDAAITGQLATMNHVMFGGLTHEPRGPAGPAAGPDHPRRAGHGVLQRLRLGVGRGRGQDGAAVLAQRRPPRQAPADDVARGLPRRHLHPDERVRPRRRHALAVDRRAGPSGLRPAGADGLRPRLQRGVRAAARRTRRRACRRHRRTRGAGRGRHAVPRSAVPDRPACALRRAMACC